MQMAYELRAPVVVNHVGRVPAEPEGAEWHLLTDALSDLGRHGQRVGVTLAARTGSENGAELRRLLDELPPATLAVDLDPGNLAANGHSAVDAVGILGSAIWLLVAESKCLWVEVQSIGRPCSVRWKSMATGAFSRSSVKRPATLFPRSPKRRNICAPCESRSKRYGRDRLRPH